MDATTVLEAIEIMIFVVSLPMLLEYGKESSESGMPSLSESRMHDHLPSCPVK